MGHPWKTREQWGVLVLCCPLRLTSYVQGTGPRKGSCKRNGTWVGVEVGQVLGPLEMEEREGLLFSLHSNSTNKGPERSSAPKCFIKRFLTDFPCQPSLEVPGGWPVRVEVTVSPCSPVLGSPLRRRLVTQLCWVLAGLPSLSSATVHSLCPSGSPFAVYDLPPVVAPGEQPSPCRGQGQVLVVAAGEQDVFPAWDLLLA